jgi:hypothetical protein
VISSSFNHEVFAAQFDTLGNPSWLTMIRFEESMGGSGHGEEIEIDDSNRVFITGGFSDSSYFDSLQPLYANNDEFFIARIDSSGHFLWAKQGSPANSDNENYTKGIKTDHSGHIYTIGVFFDTIVFPPLAALTTMGYEKNGFLVKHDINGQAICARHHNIWFQDLAIDTFGNIYTISGDEFIGGNMKKLIVSKWDMNCNHCWDSIISRKLTGISDISFQDKINIYPNPTNGIITIDFANQDLQNVVIELFSVSGQLIKKKRIKRVSHNIRFNINDLTNAIYFLRFTSEIGVNMKKIILKKD